MPTLTDYAPPMSKNKEWISRAEAATRIGVNVATIDRYVSKGVIRSRKNELTRRVTLSAEDVEAARQKRAET
jgi:predicted site-specific integrase-resolvase